MEMPIFYVNFSSLNYPNLNDESLGPYGWFYKNVQSLVLMYGVVHGNFNGKSQNVHTADLGYLGFQDYLKKFAAL